MNLIHRHSPKVSNKLALAAAVMLVFSSAAGLKASTVNQEASALAGTPQAVNEQVVTTDADRKTRKVNVSLLLFGRG